MEPLLREVVNSVLRRLPDVVWVNCYGDLTNPMAKQEMHDVLFGHSEHLCNLDRDGKKEALLRLFWEHEEVRRRTLEPLFSDCSE